MNVAKVAVAASDAVREAMLWAGQAAHVVMFGPPLYVAVRTAIDRAIQREVIRMRPGERAELDFTLLRRTR